MLEIKELLKLNKDIVIVVENEEFPSFLKYMKKEGFIWRSGKVIKPDKDLPSIYSKQIVVTSDYFIAQPVGFIYLLNASLKPRYYFKDFEIKEINEDSFDKSERVKRYDVNFRFNEEYKEKAFKKRCKDNREISLIQIKYKNIYKKLPKNFFVHYENDDELLKLFLLFKKYGYENIYDIDLDCFKNDPKVICVDNEDITFKPSDLTLCSIALNSNKKIYSTEYFEKMLNDIFK